MKRLIEEPIVLAIQALDVREKEAASARLECLAELEIARASVEKLEREKTTMIGILAEIRHQKKALREAQELGDDNRRVNRNSDPNQGKITSLKAEKQS